MPSVSRARRLPATQQAGTIDNDISIHSPSALILAFGFHSPSPASTSSPSGASLRALWSTTLLQHGNLLRTVSIQVLRQTLALLGEVSTLAALLLRLLLLLLLRLRRASSIALLALLTRIRALTLLMPAVALPMTLLLLATIPASSTTVALALLLIATLPKPSLAALRASRSSRWHTRHHRHSTTHLLHLLHHQIEAHLARILDTVSLHRTHHRGLEHGIVRHSRHPWWCRGRRRRRSAGARHTEERLHVLRLRVVLRNRIAHVLLLCAVHDPCELVEAVVEEVGLVHAWLPPDGILLGDVFVEVDLGDWRVGWAPDGYSVDVESGGADRGEFGGVGKADAGAWHKG